MGMTELPLSRLITERARELGLRRSALVARCGYRNISKGIRRLEQVLAADLAGTEALLQELPKALDLSSELIQQTVDETVSQLAAEEEALWRASFEPAAYLLGKEKRPSQICIYGLTGGADRWLKIPLDLSQPPLSYAAQAHAVARRTPFVGFFGPTTGFVVNYTANRAVHFDLEGEPVETLTRAYRPGEATFYLSGRQVSPRALGGILGTKP